MRENLSQETGGAGGPHDLPSGTGDLYRLMVPGKQTNATVHKTCALFWAALKLMVRGSGVSIHIEPEFKAKRSGAAALSEGAPEKVWPLYRLGSQPITCS